MKRLFNCLALSLFLTSCLSEPNTKHYYPASIAPEDKPGVWRINPSGLDFNGRDIQKDHALLYKKLEDIERRLILLQQDRNKLDVSPP